MLEFGGGGIGIPTADIISATAAPSANPTSAPAQPSSTLSSMINFTICQPRLPSARIVPNSPIRSKTAMLTELITLSGTRDRMMSWSTPNCRSYRSTVFA